MGLSFVRFARLLGLGYIGVVEKNEHKHTKALELGADEVFTPESAELAKLSQRRGKPLDAVIDAVGHESVINAGLPLIKLGGSICVYGVIADPLVHLDKGAGPYNFNLFVHQWPTRRRERAAMEPLCAWIREGKLKAAEFILSLIHIFLMVSQASKPCSEPPIRPSMPPKPRAAIASSSACPQARRFRRTQTRNSPLPNE